MNKQPPLTAEHILYSYTFVLWEIKVNKWLQVENVNLLNTSYLFWHGPATAEVQILRWEEISVEELSDHQTSFIQVVAWNSSSCLYLYLKKQACFPCPPALASDKNKYVKCVFPNFYFKKKF